MNGFDNTDSSCLKQESRELELINKITRLQWDGTLENGVSGNTHSTLLKSCLKVYGPKNVSEVCIALYTGEVKDKNK